MQRPSSRQETLKTLTYSISSHLTVIFL